jgi:hypothetical protein
MQVDYLILSIDTEEIVLENLQSLVAATTEELQLF